LTKVYQVLQRLAIRLAQSLPDLSQLAQQLATLQARWLKFALKDRHKTQLSTLAELRQQAEPCHKLT
jgi:hypothetical protein